MPLADAILDLVDDMENDARQSEHSGVHDSLLNYAKQLRRIVKATGSPSVVGVYDPQVDIGAQIMEKARQEFRNKRPKEQLEELEPRMCLIKGGPNDGDTIDIHPVMPVGARMEDRGIIYQLEQDGCLHFIGGGSEKASVSRSDVPRLGGMRRVQQ